MDHLLDPVTSLLGSSGSCSIQLYGSEARGFDIDNVLSGTLKVWSTGSAFAHCGITMTVLQELYVGGEFCGVTKEKVVVLEERGWVGSEATEHLFSITFHEAIAKDEGEAIAAGASAEVGVVTSANPMTTGSTPADVVAVPVSPGTISSISASEPRAGESEGVTALSSSGSSSAGNTQHGTSPQRSKKEAGAMLSPTKMSTAGEKGRVGGEKAAAPRDELVSEDRLARDWFESCKTRFFEIRHRIVATVIRPWYCYSNITATCGASFYRVNTPTLQQTSRSVGPLMLHDCGGLCLLQLSSRFVHVEAEILATLTLKGLRQPFNSAYLLLLRAEYVDECQADDVIVRAHHIFGPPSAEILQQLPRRVLFSGLSSGYADRVDEGALDAPQPGDVVVRGTRISLRMPLRVRRVSWPSTAAAHTAVAVAGAGVCGVSDGSSGGVGGGAFKGDGPLRDSMPQLGRAPGSSISLSTDSDTEVSDDVSEMTDGTHSSVGGCSVGVFSALDPSIDTSKSGLAFSRAPGPIQWLLEPVALSGGGGAADSPVIRTDSGSSTTSGGPVGRSALTANASGSRSRGDLYVSNWLATNADSPTSSSNSNSNSNSNSPSPRSSHRMRTASNSSSGGSGGGSGGGGGVSRGSSTDQIGGLFPEMMMMMHRASSTDSYNDLSSAQLAARFRTSSFNSQQQQQQQQQQQKLLHQRHQPQPRLLRQQSTSQQATSGDTPPSMSASEVERFSREAYEGSVAVRYYLRLVAQDSSRQLFWNSQEIILHRG